LRTYAQSFFAFTFFRRNFGAVLVPSRYPPVVWRGVTMLNASSKMTWEGTMSEKACVTVALRVQLPAGGLEAVVKLMPEWKKRNPQIAGGMDSADLLNLMVSRFLQAGDFEGFVRAEMGTP
jgi:hypothetical protein